MKTAFVITTVALTSLYFLAIQIVETFAPIVSALGAE